MPLDHDTRLRVANHLVAKWGNKPCPMCGGTWAMHGYVNMPLSESPTENRFGGPNLPSVALVCGGCGYTILVNLVIAGVVPGVSGG